MISLAKIDEIISTYVKPQTYLIAVKMLKSGDDISEGAKHPLRDFGAAFSLCQALALCRKEGLTLVLDKQSQSCPIALVGLGFVRPEEYLSGKYALAPINQSVEARKKAADALPRFPYEQFNAIVISPLPKAGFDPDVILFYGSGAQVMRMIQAAVFTSGESLTSASTGSGGCLLPIVSAILEGKCKFAVPGNGERRLGLIADGELAFAMPKNRFQEVVDGLKLSHEGKQTYPISPGYLKLAYQLPPSYVDLRQRLIEHSGENHE
ncbi:MAG: DUF169 domain-containing protein [Deltaproteobacteria bacterium]